MNLPLKLSLVAVVVLVAAAGLGAGIYYLARSAEDSTQTFSASPPPQAAPVAPAPADASQRVSPTDVPAQAPTGVAAATEGRGDAPPTATLVGAPEGSTPTPGPGPSLPLVSRQPESPAPDLSGPPVLSPSVDAAAAASPTPPAPHPTPDAPSVEPGGEAVSTGGQLKASDPVPPTPGGDSNGQVQFIPDKAAPQYPDLSSLLNLLVATVESGQATPQQAAQGAPIHQDDAVAVTIHLSAKGDAVVRFLEDKGGDPRNVGVDYIEAYVPVTLLGSLSQQPGVTSVREIVPPQPAGPSGGPALP
ncbi:MAG: hypothetical protein OXI91_10865 [Chloroflexota bacterium]|nr:hypothetical protein [Chloroflexota bacterium]